jgi:hypothetical protein
MKNGTRKRKEKKAILDYECWEAGTLRLEISIGLRISRFP